MNKGKNYRKEIEKNDPNQDGIFFTFNNDVRFSASLYGQT